MFTRLSIAVLGILLMQSSGISALELLARDERCPDDRTGCSCPPGCDCDCCSATHPARLLPPTVALAAPLSPSARASTIIAEASPPAPDPCDISHVPKRPLS